MTSDEALALDKLPDRIVIVGGGYIALEFAGIFQGLGVNVTLMFRQDLPLRGFDTDLRKTVNDNLRRRNIDVRQNCSPLAITRSEDDTLTLSTSSGDIHADAIMFATGRKPNTSRPDLGLLGIGVQLDADGAIIVDEYSRTSVQNVWAVGDAVRGPMLAHKGSEEASAVVETIAGQHGHIDFNTIPWVIYTEPEIAWVGKTEEQLKEAGVEYKVGTFPFAANGRALAMNEPTGMVKLLADKETDELLGAHIYAANAADLLSECVVAMEFKGCAEDLARIVHAHPTLSEAVFEAAMNVDKRAIHKAN